MTPRHYNISPKKTNANSFYVLEFVHLCNEYTTVWMIDGLNKSRLKYCDKRGLVCKRVFIFN